MRTLTLSLAILFVGLQASAQTRFGKKNATQYGFSSTVVNTNSGFGSAVGLSFNVSDKRKMLSAGLLLSNDANNTVSGARFEFRYDLSKKGSKLFHIPVHYYVQTLHMLRRDKTSYANLLKAKGISSSNTSELEVRSVEHYLGVGTEISIFEGFYFDSGVGMGAYIASPKKLTDSSESFAGATPTSGLGFSVKFGVGYRF